MVEKALCWEEIFLNEKGGIYQCSAQRKIVFVFQDKVEYLRINDFFSLQKMIAKIDVEKMLLDTSFASEIEILSPVFFQHFFILSITDILALQDLLEGAMVMLELQTILYERLYSMIV